MLRVSSCATMQDCWRSAIMQTFINCWESAVVQRCRTADGQQKSNCWESAIMSNCLIQRLCMHSHWWHRQTFIQRLCMHAHWCHQQTFIQRLCMHAHWWHRQNCKLAGGKLAHCCAQRGVAVQNMFPDASCTQWKCFILLGINIWNFYWCQLGVTTCTIGARRPQEYCKSRSTTWFSSISNNVKNIICSEISIEWK